MVVSIINYSKLLTSFILLFNYYSNLFANCANRYNYNFIDINWKNLCASASVRSSDTFVIIYIAAVFFIYYLHTNARNANMNWSRVCLVRNDIYILLTEPAPRNIFLEEFEEP